MACGDAHQSAHRFCRNGIGARTKNYERRIRNRFRNFLAKITFRITRALDIEDHRNWCPLAKHLETCRTVCNDIDLISFRGEKSLQNFLQSTIALDNQNRLHCGQSQFGSSSVQGFCQASWLKKRLGCSLSSAQADLVFTLLL